MRVVGYIRWSPRPILRWSEEVQRADIMAWAQDKGHEIVDWYIDRATSGDRVRRAGRDAMLDRVRGRGAEAICCADLSRWTREDALDAFALLRDLRDTGVEVHWVAEDWLDLSQPFAHTASRP